LDKRIVLGIMFILLLVFITFIIQGAPYDCSADPRNMTNCTTYGCFIIKASNGSSMAVIDSGGFMDIKGSYTESVTPPASNGNDLVFKNASTGNNVTLIDANGSLYLLGTVTDDAQAYCTAPAGSFVIEDTSGNCVAYINASGDLFLRGRLCYGSNINV